MGKPSRKSYAITRTNREHESYFKTNYTSIVNQDSKEVENNSQ